MAIGIVGGGPEDYVPDLHAYPNITCWIGADKGAVTLIQQGLKPDLALGDFDSVTKKEMEKIRVHAREVKTFPPEKDETDLELAVMEAQERKSSSIYFFGVTGGRLDHSLANVQQLYRLEKQGIKGTIIDKGNQISLAFPGTIQIRKDDMYPYISFLPFTTNVSELTLQHFYYPLQNGYLEWGSTLCMSNQLLSEKGTFSFSEGILMVIKSRDVLIDE
ncbi:thiamine diphosphokinase [Sediminibacillus halophilus]|uniref:Thiamine diphosphokinase n=1 Tax=Sediminibacillus halophilus TaxID=482461 RepID=A0A1G9MMA7_9BACI|nr:thiamine diphosphokinase [Sediminibacillus halophilus]SDL75400.1 thiamine pyrophosphokinase [Sediminibacillus halophilus]